MSAPTTPAEMADWLEANIVASNYLPPSEADRQAFGAIVAYLRAVPTDAQKIEALKAAADAAESGITGVRMWTQRGSNFRAFAHDSATFAHKALRLLGLPTE